MTVVTTTVRISVILLSIAGTLGHVAYLDALWWHTLGWTSTVARDVGTSTLSVLAAHAIVSLVCSVLAIALVLHESRRSPASRALGIAFGAWSYLMAYSGVTMLLRPVAPGLTREIFEAHFLAVEVLGLAGLVRFTASFPRPLHGEELRPSPTLPAMLVPFHRLGVAMRRPRSAWTAAALVLLVLWGWTLASGGELSDAGLSHLMDLVRFGAAGLVVANLHRSWNVATEGDRDGLLWLAGGLAIMVGAVAILIGGNVLGAVTGFPEPDVAWRPILLDLGTIGFFVVLALSILHRPGMDPARMARTVMTASLVITAGLFLAAALEALFTGRIVPVTLRTGVGTAVAFAITLSTYRSSARRIASFLEL